MWYVLCGVGGAFIIESSNDALTSMTKQTKGIQIS